MDLVTQRPDGPLEPTTFTIFDDPYVTLVANYHWNDGQGKAGGQVILRLPPCRPPDVFHDLFYRPPKILTDMNFSE
jgi:hypothetical protein